MRKLVTFMRDQEHTAEPLQIVEIVA